MIILKTPTQIEKIKISCKIVANFLSNLKTLVVPGITTDYLEQVANELATTSNALAGFKNYKGYPYAICASVNNHVVHGFPSKNILKDGDILSVDFGILKDYFYGDAAVTLPVGAVTKQNQRLIDTTKECLYKGIEKALAGNRVGDISNAIQTHAESKGYSVVREFVGHAVGKELHERPQIPNYGKSNKGAILKAGMVLAIEPMLIEGPDCRVFREANGWTISATSGNYSAHFEHTIEITEGTPNILSCIS
jgi:methionyl aminopeptidase